MQIGDENVHLVRNVLDEVFGSENAISLITVRKTGAVSSPDARLNSLATIGDFIVWYAKSKTSMKYRQLFTDKPESGATESQYRLEDEGGIYQSVSMESNGYAESFHFPVVMDGKEYRPALTRHWSTTEAGIARVDKAGRILKTPGKLRFKKYLADFPVTPIANIWTDLMGASGLIYVVQTNEKVIERCILMTTDPGDLVLDPTCGSGTTAYVAEQWGRRWITCDTSRVALALARTRMMAAKYSYYLLADSPEGIKKETELTGKMPPEYKTEGDIRKGFVYKRVPHVTLKSIANNPDIKEGMTRQQIDAAIARHADTETLCDQPYEDNKRVRVCGPFSVESLSPHRVLSTADENQNGTVSEQEARKQQDFATMILDNLKKSGVQNTRKAERLTFDRLDPYAGAWLHAAGEYTDAEGKTRRVAVSLGPEHGTVGPQQVKEAAKEAVQGVGFDMLIVCGFAFDPHVAEEVKRYGKLTVLPAKMNPDLAMGDELLKKTGAGNLFMVFGEPDVEIRKQKDGQIVAEIKGVDVYDPTTGQIRSASTDDIACWFIDTDYNGESFFVRHAYFTGAEEPYDKLKRALRADIDEAAWSSLYSTVSRPFDKPETGKIAVKVINHYGDEVLKVFEV